MGYGRLKVTKGYPNDIRLTLHDAGVIGDPVGNKHRKEKDQMLEKIGKGSYGVAEPPSKSKWYRFGVEFLRTESYITNFQQSAQSRQESVVRIVVLLKAINIF